MRKLISAFLLVSLLFLLIIPASAAHIISSDSGLFTQSEIVRSKSKDAKDKIGTKPICVYVDGVLKDNGTLCCTAGDIFYVPLIDFLRWVGITDITENDERGRIIVRYLDTEINISTKRAYYTINDMCYYTKALVPSFAEKPYMATVKELCSLFDIRWTWNGLLSCIKVTSDKSEPKTKTYDDSDLYWMSHIIEAEAGVESFDGKIAVGNVILNRIASEKYPDTIYDVIFDNRSGIQFAPAYSGSIYKDPGADSIAAAKLVLDGVVVIEEALYFQPTYRAAICWAGRNRTYIGSIDGHAFWK